MNEISNETLKQLIKLVEKRIKSINANIASNTQKLLRVNEYDELVKTIKDDNSCFGNPAFGFTMIGSEVYSLICLTIGIICLGPIPQLIPNASTRSPSKRATTDGISPPLNNFPFSSKITVANTGKSVFSLAANTAAFNS